MTAVYETYEFEGAPLSTNLYEVDVVDVDQVPELVGEDFQSLVSHGSLFSPKVFGPVTKFLSVLIYPRDPLTGAMPSDIPTQRMYARQNYESLVGQLRPGFTDLQTLYRVMEDGITRRRIACYVKGGWKPVRVGNSHLRVVFEIECPLGYWEDEDATFTNDVLVNAGATSLDGNGGFTDLTEATAPLVMEFQIYGPVTNPKLEDSNRGNCYFRYNGTVPDGAILYVNRSTNNEFRYLEGQGFSLDLTLAEHFGDAYWLVLHKEQPTTKKYKLTFTGSGSGANTKCRVFGRRRYL